MARGLQFCIQYDFTRQPPNRPETHLKSAQQGNVSEERLSNHGKAEETCKTVGETRGSGGAQHPERTTLTRPSRHVPCVAPIKPPV